MAVIFGFWTEKKTQIFSYLDFHIWKRLKTVFLLGKMWVRSNRSKIRRRECSARGCFTWTSARVLLNTSTDWASLDLFYFLLCGGILSLLLLSSSMHFSFLCCFLFSLWSFLFLFTHSGWKERERGKKTESNVLSSFSLTIRGSHCRERERDQHRQHWRFFACFLSGVCCSLSLSPSFWHV